MKNNIIIILFCIGLINTSCNSTKYVSENSYLLKKNRVYVNGSKEIKDDLKNYIIQRPNQRILGIPLSLYFYNLGDKNFESDYTKWKLDHKKKYRFLKNVFSDKQARNIHDFKLKTHLWFLENGNPPSIVDSIKIKETEENLSLYYFNKGYLNTSVFSKVDTLSHKKISINYLIKTGKPFIIDSITTSVQSPVIDSLLRKIDQESHLKEGTQFNYASFKLEQERITNAFRNLGLYRFTKNAIKYSADTLSLKNRMNINLSINDSINDRLATVQKIKKVQIYPDYSFYNKDAPIIDTIVYNNYHFLVKGKLKYSPKKLIRSIFIEPGKVYRDKDRNLTRAHLRNLKNFKSVEIKYNEIDDHHLDASIYLTPSEKFGFEYSTEFTHSNIRRFGISGRISFLSRNTFRGAEILKLSVQGAFLNSQDVGSDDRLLNSWELGGDLTLETPRFILPFFINKIIPKNKSPKTILSVGTSLQKNIGLDRQKYTGIISYIWNENARKAHNIEPANVQLINTLNPDSYFSVYSSEFQKIKDLASNYFGKDINQNEVFSFINTYVNDDFLATNPEEYNTIQDAVYRYSVITEDAFIPSFKYTFTYDTRVNYKDFDFTYLKSRFVSSGNLLALLSNTTDATNVTKVSLNTPIAQYLKLDVEYKKFWSFFNNNVFGFRTFLGFIAPINNSTIPFTRSYFVGGPNDLRAWKIYELGPGPTQSGLEYNTGNLKFLASLEYRFSILNNIKGAFFVDSGAIWDTTSSRFTDTDENFDALSSLSDIAVGSGFGLRYDTSFLLIRFDIGFKTYEPYLAGNQKWFVNNNFQNAVYNFSIGYPF